MEVGWLVPAPSVELPAVEVLAVSYVPVGLEVPGGVALAVVAPDPADPPLPACWGVPVALLRVRSPGWVWVAESRRTPAPPWVAPGACVPPLSIASPLEAADRSVESAGLSVPAPPLSVEASMMRELDCGRAVRAGRAPAVARGCPGTP